MRVGWAATRLGCDRLDGHGARGALQLRLAALHLAVLGHRRLGAPGMRSTVESRKLLQSVSGRFRWVRVKPCGETDGSTSTGLAAGCARCTACGLWPCALRTPVHGVKKEGGKKTQRILTHVCRLCHSSLERTRIQQKAAPVDGCGIVPQCASHIFHCGTKAPFTSKKTKNQIKSE